MLGPFRIRNLPPRSPRRPAAGSTVARRPSVDGEAGSVVSVNGERYDQLIQALPEATLKYTDADKDIITVGSQQELQDRLAEPVRKPRRIPTQKPKEDTSIDAVPLRPASPAMHVFEIDPIEAAVQLWHKIEYETSHVDAEEHKDEFEMDGASEKVIDDGQVLTEKSGRTLEEKRASYLRNCLPPQLHGPDESTSAEPDVHQKTTKDSPLSSNGDKANVLTAKGVMQAQLAGEQLRERLGNPGPRIDRANAVNSWASYSQPVESSESQERLRPRPLSHPPGAFEWVKSSTKCDLSRPASMMAEPLLPSSLPRLAIPGSSRDADAHLSEAVHGSLLPAFYENVQASLAKLSPEMTSLSGKVTVAEEKAKVGNAGQPDETTTRDGREVETAELAEVTLSKMVFKSIGEMADILAKLNNQFDAQLTPKLVSERLKSKEKLLPAHRQDTVRDLFTVRRAIEDFALEVAETKQTLARFEDAKVFPESTNLVDFNCMTAAAYSFGRLVRSMDDMIIAARRGMVPAQIEDGEPKFHTPRRLARIGYEDVWSVTIASVPSSFSRADVRTLVDEVRHERKLDPLEIREIIFHEGIERSAEIVIDGVAQAQETWKSLMHASERSLRLLLSERQINLTRKHYPTVYRCSSAPLKEVSNIPLAPPSQADIDVARLKALQDRRAAWRKEFKARTQSVRFTDSTKVINDTPTTGTQTGPPCGPIPAPVDQFGASESQRAPAPSESRARAMAQRHRRVNERTLKATRSEMDLQQHAPHKFVRPVQSQTFEMPGRPQAQPHSDSPVLGRPATYHSIRYPPGPFPPPPPGAPSTLPQMNQLGLQRPPLPQPFYPQLPPPMPPAYLSKSTGPLRPPPPPAAPYTRIQGQLPHRTSHPQLHHQASDPNFAPLPSFPALEPVRLQASGVPMQEPQPRALPGAWPVTEGGENESSGAFFRRMIGRSPAPANEVSPMLSPVLGATQPSNEPHPPVSPISPSPGLGRSSTVHIPRTSSPVPPVQASLRRSATVATAPTRSSPPPKSAGGPWSRRPYSETFDGAGRHTRDRTRHVAPQPAVRGVPAAEPATMAPHQPPPSLPSVPTTTMPAPNPPPATEAAPSDWAQIKWCMNQLQELGYGDMHNGGMERLAMYAHLTDGQLEATIDLIEEERQAWNEKDGTSTEPDVARDI